MPLKSAEVHKKWSPTGCRDTGKSSPLNVRLTGHAGHDTPGTALRPAYTLMA